MLKYSYLIPFIYIYKALSLCYFILFYFLLVFLVFYRSLKENEAFLEISCLRSKLGKTGVSTRAINRRRPVIECTTT